MPKLYVFILLFVVDVVSIAQTANKDKFFFIDTHNDVLSKQISNGADLALSQPELNFDLVKASKGRMAGQVFSIWCDEVFGKGAAFARANREIDSLLALIQRNNRTVMLAKNSSELKSAIKQKKFAAMIGVEGGHMIEERMEFLDSLIARGMKYLTLTWNNSTTWASSARDEITKKDSLTHLGLTEMGKQIVRRLNEAGVMVDVSHVGETTFGDVMALSTKPVIASHSCVWSLRQHGRNLKDEQLKAIGSRGGVVFVNFYSAFLDSTYEIKRDGFVSRHKPELDSLTTLLGDQYMAGTRLFSLYKAETDSFRPPLSTLVNHIDYIAKLIGIDHVGLGADFDGAESFPLQMDDVSCYPLLVTELKNRGYSNRDIKKIASGNFIRVLKENERKL